MVSSTDGLADEDRLEAALQRRVLLDVLAVFVEGGRADGPQLAAGEHRLEHVGGVHGAFGGAGAHEGVHLIDEEDDLALGFGDLLEHGLEPVLELAAVLGAGDQRADVQRHDPLVLEPFGHVAVDDALGQSLDQGGLAHAGLADQHRVVLGAAGEHLDDAADLVVAADDRVELAAARLLGEVAAVLLQRLKFFFGVLVGDALAAADLGQRRQQPFLGDAGALRISARGCAVDLGGGEQQVLGADVVVLELVGHLPAASRSCLQPRADIGLLPGRAADFRHGGHRLAAVRRQWPPGSAPSFCRIGTTMPSLCSSRASSRCSGSICCCPAASASFCAAAIASCALMVNFSGCI